MRDRKVVFIRRAKEELRLAYRWYVSQDAQDDAERLLGEVEDASIKLHHFAHAFRAVDRDARGREIRQLRLSTFPYHLVHTIVDDEVVRVIAVKHVSRKPSL